MSDNCERVSGSLSSLAPADIYVCVHVVYVYTHTLVHIHTCTRMCTHVYREPWILDPQTDIVLNHKISSCRSTTSKSSFFIRVFLLIHCWASALERRYLSLLLLDSPNTWKHLIAATPIPKPGIDPSLENQGWRWMGSAELSVSFPNNTASVQYPELFT